VVLLFSSLRGTSPRFGRSTKFPEQNVSKYFSTIPWSPLVTSSIQVKKIVIMRWDTPIWGDSFSWCSRSGKNWSGRSRRET
jgi:hypothetical protein